MNSALIQDPHPAPPILASTLLGNLQRVNRTKSLRTGFRPIDEDVLDGGLRYGEITGLAGPGPGFGGGVGMGMGVQGLQGVGVERVVSFIL